VSIKTYGESTVELIKHNASDEDVAYAAWVSNFAADARNRDTSRIEGLINFLYKNKHMSPFEHGSFTFFVDRGLGIKRYPLTVLKKLSLVGKDLPDYSLETVEMFHKDATAAGYQISLKKSA